MNVWLSLDIEASLINATPKARPLTRCGARGVMYDDAEMRAAEVSRSELLELAAVGSAAERAAAWSTLWTPAECERAHAALLAAAGRRPKNRHGDSN